MREPTARTRSDAQYAPFSIHFKGEIYREQTKVDPSALAVGDARIAAAAARCRGARYATDMAAGAGRRARRGGPPFPSRHPDDRQRWAEPVTGDGTSRP